MTNIWYIYFNLLCNIHQTFVNMFAKCFSNIYILANIWKFDLAFPAGCRCTKVMMVMVPSKQLFTLWWAVNFF